MCLMSRISCFLVFWKTIYKRIIWLWWLSHYLTYPMVAAVCHLLVSDSSLQCKTVTRKFWPLSLWQAMVDIMMTAGRVLLTVICRPCDFDLFWLVSELFVWYVLSVLGFLDIMFASEIQGQVSGHTDDRQWHAVCKIKYYVFICL